MKKRDDISFYLKQMQGYPPLSHEKLMDLFREYEEAKSDSIKNKIILSNLRLVISIAKKFSSKEDSLSDLIQEGNIGLISAIERFQYQKGFKFSTYARWWIVQAIMSYLKSKKSIRLPAHAATIQKKILELIAKSDVEFTLEELAEKVQATTTVVRAALNNKKSIISLSQPINSETDETIGDKIIDQKLSSNPSSILEYREISKIILKTFDNLSEKEKTILSLRYNL